MTTQTTSSKRRDNRFISQIKTKGPKQNKLLSQYPERNTLYQTQRTTIAVNIKMNPHQKNKVDIAVSCLKYLYMRGNIFSPEDLQALTLLPKSLSPDEQRLFRLYGKLPSKSDHLAKHLKERKYFDSGDYALSKAGKASSVDTGSVGSEHPLPENIPHLSSPGAMGVNGGSGNINLQMGTGGAAQSGSPVKESSFLNRETSIDELEDQEKENQSSGKVPSRFSESVSPPPIKEGIPIRR